MQLWGVDIVGGICLVDAVTGELRDGEGRAAGHVPGGVPGVRRGPGQARVPEEVLTASGKQFTDRFDKHGPRNGEVLFDKICSRNGITHRHAAGVAESEPYLDESTEEVGVGVRLLLVSADSGGARPRPLPGHATSAF